MTFAVFIHRSDSIYDDDPAERYQYRFRPITSPAWQLFFCHRLIHALGAPGTMRLVSREKEMARYLAKDENALRRIAVLLLALADLADRAGSMSLPVRAVVFSILRYAETIAWALALETASTAAARPRCRRPEQPILPGTTVEPRPGPADLSRLALSLRALALIISYGLVRSETSDAGAPVWTRISRIQDWFGPQALPAPDTS